MANVKYDDIKNLNISWENYAGQKVEEFIKKELKMHVGYLYRTPAKINDYYYILAFQSPDDFDKWREREDDSLVLFRVQLPNVENDVFSVQLQTNTPTGKMVNLGDGIKIGLRYTSISENPVTHVIQDTYNDGILYVLRAANGSAYEEVARLTLRPAEYVDTENYTEIDITPYLADGTNQIRLRVEDSVNGTVSNNINFNEIINTQLILENAMDLSKPMRSLDFEFYVQGQVQKTLNVKIQGDDINETFSTALGEATYIEVPYEFIIDRTLTTGIKNVDAWLSVDGTELESPHVIMQVYYMDAAVDESVVILNNVATEVTNYTNIHFCDFTIYNKRSDVTITVETNFATLLEYTFPDCQTETLYSFTNVLEVTSSQPLINATLRVRTEDYEVTQRISIDNSVDFNPTAGYDFYMNPKSRDNNEANPATIINEATNLIVPSTFRGFTYVRDGWVTGQDGIKVLRCVGGDQVEIEYDALENVTNGTSIEFDFRTYNVFDSSDIVFRFCNYNDQDNPIGFEMSAQDACFMTNDNQVRRDQDVMYTEGNRTHMVVNIIPNLGNTGLNYVRIFVNGTINREFIYANSDLFKYNNLPVKFIIGSEHCDIDIYSIRVYKKSISASQIRQNYMSSLATVEEKVDFKTTNDILSANETISYDKAKVKYNTLIWTGRVPSYTTGNVKYTGNLEVNILDDAAHSGKISNVEISGQGSSSRGYWKWNHQYKWKSASRFTNKAGEVSTSGYALSDDDPEATKLVAKLNWASSMQSHKQGSTALYNDLWKAVIGGNSITKNPNYTKCRVAVHEKPFLYFVRSNEFETPVFYGLMTFGSGKADEPTFVGSYDAFPQYVMLEGSDNGMPLTLRQVPWIDDEVVYNEEEEYFEYADAGNLDYNGGNINNYIYYRDAYTFSYLHSPFLVPFNGDLSALNGLLGADASKQYWNTSNGDVYRYDWRSQTWVDGGTIRTQDYLWHLTTQEDVDEGRAELVGELIVDQYPVYSKLNLVEQTGIALSGDSSADNTAFIDWRVADFKTNISRYYNVNDTLYNMAFIRMIAASDNWCKNTYEYLDPASRKLCWLNDDMDTIFLSDNVGRKTKPYYVEEHDMNGSQAYFNGSDNVFFNLMEKAFKTEYRAMMRTMLNTMSSNEFGGSVEACIDRYFFSTQKYFPAVAYNETARLLYEEASVAQAAGQYTNGTPAISQSLGDQLQAELGWWRKREIYMQSWAASAPFAVRSTGSLGFRSMLTTDSQRPSYSFELTPWQWLYPKVGIGQTLGTDNQRVVALNKYNTISMTTDGNTDSFIYGADYYTNFGEFGGHSIGETFNLSGARLLEFSADARKVASYQFRPTAMTVSCPVLRKLVVYGCSTLRGVLDLTSSTKMQYVDVRGTGLSAVVFPQTETLTDVNINNVISLNMVGCPNLTNFNASGTSNLTSLTTDSPLVLGYYIEQPDITGIQELHMNNVTLDLRSEASAISDNLYTLLVRENSTASGRIYLNKTLTLAEQQALVQKYGNIDNPQNNLYVEYIIETQDSIEISGDSSITYSKSKTYSVSYLGNDIRSYQWSVENGSYQLINEYTISVTADGQDASADVIVNCTVTRLRNTDLSTSKNITVDAYVYITEVSLGSDVNYYRPDSYTIPVSYVPQNFTVDVRPEDIVATLSGVGTNAVVELADLQRVVITTTDPAQDITGTLKLRVTDVDGHVAEDTINITIWKTVNIGNVVGQGTDENPVQYGNLAPGNNDNSSAYVLQSASDNFVLTMNVPDGYRLGSATCSNPLITVSGGTANSIQLTYSNPEQQTTNITIPLINNTTGNVMNYIMNGVRIKRNVYIQYVIGPDVNWRIGDTGTIRVNYSVTPGEYNVPISSVHFAIDNTLSPYLTLQSQGDGYALFAVNNQSIDNYVEGNVTVTIYDENNHVHEGEILVRLWDNLDLTIAFVGENSKNISVEENSSTSASSLGEFQFRNSVFSISSTMPEEYSLINAAVTVNGETTLFTAVANFVEVTGLTGNGTLSATLTVRNNLTGDNYTYTVTSLSWRNHVYVNQISAEPANWFGSGYLSLNWTYLPEDNNGTTVTDFSLSSNIQNYVDSFIQSRPTRNSSVTGNIQTGNATYSLANVDQAHVQGSYTVTVQSNGQTYTATGEVNLFNQKYINVSFSGDVVTNYTDVHTGSNYLTPAPKVECAPSKPFTMTVTGFDSDYWTVTASVTGGTGISALSPVSSVETDQKTFNCTFGSEGTSTINVVLTNKLSGDVLTYTLESFQVAQNIYIESISFQGAPYTWDKTGQRTLIYTYSPANYTVQPNQFTANITGDGASAISVISVSNTTMALNVTGEVTGSPKTADITVNVTDAKGNIISGTATATLTNNITAYKFDGVDAIDRPMIPGTWYTINVTTVPTGTTENWYISNVELADNRMSVKALTANARTFEIKVNDSVIDTKIETTATLTIAGSQLSTATVDITARLVSDAKIEIDGWYLMWYDYNDETVLSTNTPVMPQFRAKLLDELGNAAANDILSMKIRHEDEDEKTFENIHITSNHSSSNPNYQSKNEYDGTQFINVRFEDSQTNPNKKEYADIYTSGTWTFEKNNVQHITTINLTDPTNVAYYQFGYPQRSNVLAYPNVDLTGTLQNVQYTNYECQFDTLRFENCVFNEPIYCYANVNYVYFTNCTINCSNPVIFKIFNNDEISYRTVYVFYNGCAITVSDYDDTQMRIPMFYGFDQQGNEVRDFHNVQVNLDYGTVDITPEAYAQLPGETTQSALNDFANEVKFGDGTTPEGEEYLRKQWGPNATYVRKDAKKETPFWMEIEVIGQGANATLSKNTNSQMNAEIRYSTTPDYSKANVLLDNGVVLFGPEDTGKRIYLWADLNSCPTNNNGFKQPIVNLGYVSNGDTITNGLVARKIGGNILSLFYMNNFTGYDTSSRFTSYDATPFYRLASYSLVGKLYLEDASGLYCCPNLFWYEYFDGCSALTAAPDLRYFTSIGYHQCEKMFCGCSSLVTPPHMNNVSSVSDYGCSQMFKECTSLTTAPNMNNVTSVGTEGCLEMFSGCTSLITAPELPATRLSNRSYKNMFYGCTALTTAPSVLPTTNVYSAGECYYCMFQGCTSLTAAPDMSNLRDLGNSACVWMFYGCTSLRTAPVLPATWAASSCYNGMFIGCTSLTTAPALPATTLLSGCYSRMFEGCTSLTTAPALPATTLATYCYSQMFKGCTSLTTAPELPVTTLADSCYENMFENCSSLTTAPELPATTLASSCYNSMFKYCSKLTAAPELPATTLVSGCYKQMFTGCSRLNYIKALFTTTPSYSYTQNWINGVASSGTFVKAADATWDVTGSNGVPSGWTIEYDSGDETNYLTFTCESDAGSISFTKASGITGTLYYKLSGGDWTEYSTAISLTQNDVVKMKGTFANGMATSTSAYSQFSMTGTIAAGGNIMTLISGDNPGLIIPSSYCFYRLFYNCTSLTTAPELPATILAYGCYYAMFNGCTSLTTAPELPATTLANNCYQDMFYGCTNLTTAPELPATTLANNCYSNMFNGCTSLTTAPELPATTLASSCYSNMFNGCTSLTTAPELPATTLASSCYYYMFNGCTNLETAPELPATALASYCYNGMFNGCTSLTTAPELPATTLASSCYQYMFNGCTSLTTAPELPATTLANYCYQNMFKGCTSLTTAPELPATTLASSCYNGMFNGCTYLTTAPELPVTTLADSCYENMFENCSSLTTAPELPATTLASSCYNGMFNGCTYLTTAPELPATTLASGCYDHMFYGCTSLTTAPVLPATTLADSCYMNMFSGCSSLNYIKAMFTSNPGMTDIMGWVIGVASSGTFVKNTNATWDKTGTSGVPSGWTVEYALN